MFNIRSKQPNMGYWDLPDASLKAAKYTPLIGKPLSPKKQAQREYTFRRDAHLGNTMRNLYGTALGGAVTYGLAKGAKAGLTGRQTLYHGTSSALVGDIRKNGLKSFNRIKGNAAAVSNATAQHMGEDAHLRTNFAFTAPHKSTAQMYAEGGKNSNIIKYSVPTWRPGISKRMRVQIMSDTVPEAAAHTPGIGDARNSLSKHIPGTTYMFKNKVPNQFMVGHKNYIPYSAKEFKQYVTQAPKKFAGGLAVTGLAGAAGYGTYRYAKKAIASHRLNKERLKRDKAELDAMKESTDMCFNRYMLRESRG